MEEPALCLLLLGVLVGRHRSRSRLLLGRHPRHAVHPLLVELQRGVRVDGLAADPAAVWADFEVAPQVLNCQREEHNVVHGSAKVRFLGCVITYHACRPRERVHATLESNFNLPLGVRLHFTSTK